MSSLSVSVVVPTRQRRDSVRRLLDALSCQTLPPSQYEVIISANGPPDGTEAMVAAFPAAFPIRHLWQAAAGRAAACNAGVRAAAGARIAIMDDDLEPAPGCLEAHLAANPGGDRIGVVGAVPIPEDDTVPPLVAYRARGFRRKMERLARLEGGLPFHQVYTGNFSIPRELFLEVGGYDEEFRLYGHEDYELALRLSRAGTSFVFSMEALAIQHYAKDLPQLAENILAEGQTALLFARKHPEILANLELSRYRSASRRRRLLRRLLLGLSRDSDRVPSAVIRAATWLEARRPASLFAIYDLLFDYLYWLGAERGLRASATASPAGASLERELQQLRSRGVPGGAGTGTA